MPAPRGTGIHNSRHHAADATDTTARPDKPGVSLVWIPCTAQRAPQNVATQIRCRRRAARRSVPLDCGCPDPWPCRCSAPPMSDNMVDAGRDAALHLLEVGRVPLLEVEVLQALWRRGGTDRELATLLHRLTGGQLA